MLGSPRFTNASARAILLIAAFHDTKWFRNVFMYLALSFYHHHHPGKKQNTLISLF